MRRSLALALLAACGDNAAAPIDAAPDATPGCTAKFTGNFIETSTATANCATLAPALELAVPAQALGVPLKVTIDLGASPVTGQYSSETVGTWSAIAVQRVGDGGCQYSAGATQVPTGSFTLALTSIEGATPHGTLAIIQYVLTLPGTDCGDFDTEQVELQF